MKFTFPRDGKALAAADHVLIIAAKGCFGPRKRTAALGKHLDKATSALAVQLGSEAGTGLLGGTATSLLGKRRVTVGALKDDFSRHNCASRAESIRKVTAGASLGKAKNAVLLVLDDESHLVPAVNAIGRRSFGFLSAQIELAVFLRRLFCAYNLSCVFLAFSTLRLNSSGSYTHG